MRTETAATVLLAAFRDVSLSRVPGGATGSATELLSVIAMRCTRVISAQNVSEPCSNRRATWNAVGEVRADDGEQRSQDFMSAIGEPSDGQFTPIGAR